MDLNVSPERNKWVTGGYNKTDRSEKKKRKKEERKGGKMGQRGRMTKSKEGRRCKAERMTVFYNI